MIITYQQIGVIDCARLLQTKRGQSKSWRIWVKSKLNFNRSPNPHMKFSWINLTDIIRNVETKQPTQGTTKRNRVREVEDSIQKHLEAIGISAGNTSTDILIDAAKVCKHFPRRYIESFNIRVLLWHVLQLLRYSGRVKFKFSLFDHLIKARNIFA